MTTSQLKSIGFDFYFRAIKKIDGSSTVEHVRLYGPSADWLGSRKPQYENEGFTVAPSNLADYRKSRSYKH